MVTLLVRHSKNYASAKIKFMNIFNCIFANLHACNHVIYNIRKNYFVGKHLELNKKMMIIYYQTDRNSLLLESFI